MTFYLLLHAARCGFTWSAELRRFVRVLVRRDALGYDVTCLTVQGMKGISYAFEQQHPAIRLDPETLRLLLPLSPALSGLAENEAAALRAAGDLKIVLNHQGEHLEDTPHERRIVGL